MFEKEKKVTGQEFIESFIDSKECQKQFWMKTIGENDK